VPAYSGGVTATRRPAAGISPTSIGGSCIDRPASWPCDSPAAHATRHAQRSATAEGDAEDVMRMIAADEAIPRAKPRVP
jgi:hypothetical protein